ncbi:cyclin-dependent kinase 2-interacting protein isoform X1 [Alosa sapidissima]|uniref:cyclin-dependent kinase 2-interacting protein isoform X1 n=1 Tax=Alosa sapidissima TaxID=34773 RepID=UPI001C09A170|nr:cyclin-dependent kinase 2-interacting protein isoform X1 [Alosa sapidissima]
MASPESHVWVGSIEGLPVVSSVKEAVEWVLAVAADDSALAEEKLKVITARLGEVDKLKENRSPRSSSGYFSRSTSASSSQSVSGYSSESTSGSSSPIGKKSASLPTNVERYPEINLMAHIIEVMGHKKKGKQGSESVQDKARIQKVQRVRDETLAKIHRIDQNFRFAEPLDDHGKRSRRGEHVINNDVIRIYSKVVDGLGERFQLITLNMDRPLDTETEADIMNVLVAHFDEHELYINANAVVYGVYSRELKTALTEFLTEPTQGNRDHVNFIVNHMNVIEAYVDPFAKIKWIRNQNERGAKYETVRHNVATMFDQWAVHFATVKGTLDELFGRTA